MIYTSHEDTREISLQEYGHSAHAQKRFDFREAINFVLQCQNKLIKYHICGHFSCARNCYCIF